MNKITIQGLQKMTLLDFPGKVACILFFGGCNMRCPFCHNAGLWQAPCDGDFSEENGDIAEETALSFLKKRQGLLEGVVLTGGEPLLREGIFAFIQKIKALGYFVKLDTNGTSPEKLEKLMSAGLIDYVAMDIKHASAKYTEATGCGVDLSAIKLTKQLLLNGNTDYEFRTTVIGGMHTPQDIEAIAQDIVGAKNYFLQPFRPNESVPNQSFAPPGGEILAKMKEKARVFLPNVKIRTIDG